MDYRILHVHTNVNACGCTQGCTDTLRESAQKVDLWKRILCRTGELNLPQQHASSMLYQLSYIPMQEDLDDYEPVDALQKTRIFISKHAPVQEAFQKGYCNQAASSMPVSFI